MLGSNLSTVVDWTNFFTASAFVIQEFDTRFVVFYDLGIASAIIRNFLRRSISQGV